MKWYYWFNGERAQKGPSKHDLGRLDLTSFGEANQRSQWLVKNVGLARADPFARFHAGVAGYLLEMWGARS